MQGIVTIRQYVVTILVSSFQVHHVTYIEVAVYSEKLMGWGGHEARMRWIRNARNTRILVRKQDSKISV